MTLCAGDVMGPAMSDLDQLLKLPTGCGEQNMLKFAPNIFIMQYLTGTNQVNLEIKAKATEFMTTGKQLLLPLASVVQLGLNLSVVINTHIFKTRLPEGAEISSQ